MPYQDNSLPQQAQKSAIPEEFHDFLNPEQRLEMITNLLGEMALEVVRRDHEQNPSNPS